jgi:DNA repair photolyase
MRWTSLEATAEPADALPLALPDAVVRRFATPGFTGITCYEVRAKSIINRVPPGSRVPFEWTINPYRGCSHACAYCLAGDTRVRMADRGTKPISELLVGDSVLGTVPDGYSRRFAETTVLAHWSSVKRAYRVSLDNGVTLVASGDHRFLTHRGWKYVSASAEEESRRYLTTGDRLLGIGRHADPSADTLDALIGVTAVEALEGEQELFDITTGTGDFIANDVVSHNCFARNTHTYLDLDAGLDFDSKIVVKVNAPELVRRELAAPRWSRAHVAMGTNVDCYQRAEGRYRLMPGIIAALRDHANPFSILTKATLITRDLPLLRRAAEVTSVGVSFSVGFVDEQLWHSVESGTPSPRRRLDAVRQFADAGFAVTVLMAPILPGLTDTDESIEETVAAIAAAGASGVVPLALHLRPGAREWYLAWLGRSHPELSQRYTQLFRGGSYSPAAYQREVTARVGAAARRHGLDPENAAEHRGTDRAGGRRGAAGPHPPAPVEAEQLQLL